MFAFQIGCIQTLTANNTLAYILSYRRIIIDYTTSVYHFINVYRFIVLFLTQLSRRGFRHHYCMLKIFFNIFAGLITTCTYINFAE